MAKKIAIEVSEQCGKDLRRLIRAVLDDDKLSRAVCGPLDSDGSQGLRRADFVMLAMDIDRELEKAKLPEVITVATTAPTPLGHRSGRRASDAVDWFGERD